MEGWVEVGGGRGVGDRGEGCCEGGVWGARHGGCGSVGVRVGGEMGERLGIWLV
jgi:hypothetical protein